MERILICRYQIWHLAWLSDWHFLYVISTNILYWIFPQNVYASTLEISLISSVNFITVVCVIVKTWNQFYIKKRLIIIMYYDSVWYFELNRLRISLWATLKRYIKYFSTLRDWNFLFTYFWPFLNIESYFLANVN